jgi:methylase of polypeptide subunit release factors
MVLHSAMPSDTTALIQLVRAVRELGYHFITPTPATHARVNARVGAEAATGLRDVFGWNRRFKPNILPAAVFDLMQTAGVAEPDGDAWRSTVRLASLGDDLFVHSAFPTTAPDAVFFGPDTYRFSSAINVELADGLVVKRAVDICSGAGPGAVAIARQRPGVEVLMADINANALHSSRINAELAGLPNLHPIESNLLSGADGDFDLIVANPPYLNDKAHRVYRHGGGSHGALLSLAILNAALPRLRPGGRLVLYTGVAILQGSDPFRQEAARHLAGWGGAWRYREIDPDVFGEELDEPAYADADRIAVVLLTVNRS